MAKPQIEKIPSYVLEKGRKNLSQNAVSQLFMVMEKLSRVEGPSKVMALNSIGVIQAYLNDYDNALETFDHALSINLSDSAFSNKLHTLKALDRLQESISLGFEFLENYPNNKRIFRFLSSNIHRLSLKNEYKQLEQYYKYFETDKEFMKGLTNYDLVYNSRTKHLQDNDINLDYFSVYLNAAYSVLGKLVTGDVQTFVFENDLNQLSIKLSADLSKNDIRFLNKEFDSRIEKLIEKNIITFDDYIYHLNKINLGFGIYNNKVEVEA